MKAEHGEGVMDDLDELLGTDEEVRARLAEKIRASNADLYREQQEELLRGAVERLESHRRLPPELRTARAKADHEVRCRGALVRFFRRLTTRWRATRLAALRYEARNRGLDPDEHGLAARLAAEVDDPAARRQACLLPEQIGRFVEELRAGLRVGGLEGTDADVWDTLRDRLGLWARFKRAERTRLRLAREEHRMLVKMREREERRELAWRRKHGVEEGAR